MLFWGSPGGTPTLGALSPLTSYASGVSAGGAGAVTTASVATIRQLVSQQSLNVTQQVYYTRVNDDGSIPTGWKAAGSGACSYTTSIGSAPPAPFADGREIITPVGDVPIWWTPASADHYKLTFVLGPYYIETEVRNPSSTEVNGSSWLVKGLVSIVRIQGPETVNYSSVFPGQSDIADTQQSRNAFYLEMIKKYLLQHHPSDSTTGVCARGWTIPLPPAEFMTNTYRGASKLWYWQSMSLGVPCLDLREHGRPPLSARVAHWKVALADAKATVAFQQSSGMSSQDIANAQAIADGIQSGTYPFMKIPVWSLSGNNTRKVDPTDGTGTVRNDFVGLFYGDETYGMLIIHATPPEWWPDTSVHSDVVPFLDPLNFIKVLFIDAVKALAEAVIQAIKDIVSEILNMACDLIHDATGNAINSPAGLAAATAAGPQVLIAYKAAQLACKSGQPPVIPPSKPISTFNALPWVFGAALAGGVAYLALRKPKPKRVESGP